MFKNHKLAVLGDALATIACAVMLFQDVRIWRQESLTFTVTMPGEESGDVTEVADIAGNEDA
jgi:hypothetical protein